MSDRIRFQCENCDKALAVAAKHRGRRVACPGCGETVVVGGVPARPARKVSPPRPEPKARGESWDDDAVEVRQPHSRGRSSHKANGKSGMPRWLVPAVIGVCLAGGIGAFGYQYAQRIAARVRGSSFTTPVAAREAITARQQDLQGEFAGITDANGMNESIPRINKLLEQLEEAKDSLHALVTEQIRKSNGVLSRSAESYEVELLRLAESPEQQSPIPEFEDQWDAIRRQSETNKAMIEEWNRLTQNESAMVALLASEDRALLERISPFSNGVQAARQQFDSTDQTPQRRFNPADPQWAAFRKKHEGVALRIHFSELTSDQRSQLSDTILETAKELNTESGSLSMRGIGDDFFVRPVADIDAFLEKAQLGKVTKLDQEGREVWIEVGGE